MGPGTTKGARANSTDTGVGARASAAEGRGGKVQIRMAGFGGQGIVLAGIILGKAVSLYEGSNAVMTQSYGPEARGGACSADVVVSSMRIHYPRVTAPDVLVLMSEEAARTYGGTCAGNAMVIVNEDLVKTLPTRPGLEIVKIPATAMAEKLGKTLVANIVMLGFVSALCGVAGFESMKKALFDSIPKGSEQLNLEALQAGYAYGLALKGGGKKSIDHEGGSAAAVSS
jgi:2-oxoglutarate ferredoxin oxidoreductase subunit gamma